ncbi:TIGR02449 family protein [Oleiphilus sp. HI0009]|uniref:TIGR02449 family protein n=1 Tax=unclassified Oleiphilus TaxID=2631174 RepID=UPI0007C35869|nr:MULTISPECIES: TIGR02449 family protein [unclassified Oleiphilus]KZX83194.1 TIGR02449 family protein [Oleiphilus sp. HI0009]KZY64280.1 TIGR02449 family protein [Oleiphilus sp. HI0066]KZY65290.1 TIGR02449 family protein [Oleiphilus sp. HI0066]KZY68490.1 TIGR02449 family protein [Oleiphilus sp. HI0067]KZZ59907.1 TIGR02449 family protein [Oleiphilus sp. HI0125]
MDNSSISRFSDKVEQLLAYCQRLEEDNARLQQSQEELHNERTQLLQKNELAKSKIEGMIGRLRALEQN